MCLVQPSALPIRAYMPSALLALMVAQIGLCLPQSLRWQALHANKHVSKKPFGLFCTMPKGAKFRHSLIDAKGLQRIGYPAACSSSQLAWYASTI
jgi:hypothetical protein